MNTYLILGGIVALFAGIWRIVTWAIASRERDEIKISTKILYGVAKRQSDNGAKYEENLNRADAGDYQFLKLPDDKTPSN